MRVLHVNKFVYRRGGAEAYMLDLGKLQEEAGWQVAHYGMAHPENPPMAYHVHFPENVEIGRSGSRVTKARSIGRMLYSPSSRRGLRDVLEDFRPDIVHLHNIYHQLSPSVLAAVAEVRVPAVMTLHDYKLVCPSYQLLDHGKVCEACMDGRFRHAVRRRCKDGSLVSSVAVAVESRLHRSTGAYAPVSRFVCPSRFLAQKMAEGGVFPDRMRVVPHFIDTQAVPVKDSAGGPIVYAGRLSAEKGVDLLVRAVGRLPRVRLDVAGDGPERESLERLADSVAPGRVRFHGRLAKAELQNLLCSATASVLPSRWYENQPMSVLDAFAAGVPVVASRLGGIPELVEEGVEGELVPAEDVGALAGALANLIDDPVRAQAMGSAGRRKVTTNFTPERHLAALKGVYEEAAKWSRR